VTETAQLGDAAWLKQSEVARLLARLDRDGEEARVVGGAVRNALMQLAVGEIDVATTAVPEEVVRRVEAAGWKAVPTGIAHGTVTVVIDGKPFEVTTLRQDVETYGRKAKVVFGRDWMADAKRRDFTINGLSASADGKICDYVGGIPDIAARRVRFIGEAQTRIAEDYLRILRFFRFHAWYGEGAPDAAGLHACIGARAGLEMLSRERVRMELLKLLLAPHATPALAVMAETGLLGGVLGGVPLLASFENMAKVEAATGIEADAVRRLGALGVFIKEDAERLALRLRLFNAEAERLFALDRWWRVSPAAGEHAAHALLYHLGTKSFADQVLLAWSRSDAGAKDEAWRALATLPQRWTAPVFPLKAADFMRRGVVAGPALGAALRAAEMAWVEADFPPDQAAIGAIADEATRETAASG
jgi:poly(A) polymerase